jgi:Cu-Zn family superoxide dismutase
MDMRRFLLRAVAVAAPLATLAVGAAVGSPSSEGEREGLRAAAVLHSAAGDAVGVARLVERDGKVFVWAGVRGQAPGFHGFHVHAVGQCVAPFTSAGGHFNPAGAGHGDHAGDLPSLLVNEDGRGVLSFATDRFALGDLNDADGSAVIVHAGRDNYANIPTRYHSHTYDVFGPDQDTLATGDAGGRVACGVIEASEGDDD